MYIYIPTLVIQRSELDNHHAINGEIIKKHLFLWTIFHSYVK